MQPQRTIVTVLLAAAAAGCGAALVFKVPPITPLDRAVFLAEREFELGGWKRSLGDEAGRRAALVHYGRALAQFRALGRWDRVAVTHSRRARVHQELDELPLVVVSLRQALALGFDDTDEQLLALNRLGDVERSAGDPSGALVHLEQALALARWTGDREKEAAALNNLALVHLTLGSPRRAVLLFTASIALWREVDNEDEERNALANLAESNLLLGRFRQVLDLTDQILASGEDVRLDTSILALRHRGIAQLELGDSREAHASLLKAHGLAQRLGNPATEAEVLNALGFWHVKVGRIERAAEMFRSALARVKRSGDKPSRGNALANLGHLHDLVGEEEKALERFEQAEEIYSELGDASAVASVLFGRSLAERGLGSVDAAFTSIERAARLLDDVRGEVGGPTFRISFLASRIDLYEQWVDLLMQRHRHEPGGGYDRRAFEMAEATRARALREVLGGGDGSPAPVPLHTPTLREIQEQVLDDESVLLFYFLGEERSYLWLVTRHALRSYQLPPRARIESLSAEAYGRVVESRKRPDRAKDEELLAELSRLLLAPVADAIQGKRLLLVLDGALYGVPFAALPEPRVAGGDAAPPLLAGHDIVSLPSASLPAALRRLTEDRPLAPNLMAVFAAPALTPDGDLPPLSFAEEEAEAILAPLPAGSSLRALRHDASRERLFRGDVNRFRIVHFATHALVNSTDPELSAFALSQVDRNGRRVEGRVTAADLQSLDLAAELVVLSACRTAGTAVRGEGLVGLAWSVMQAGAPRVLLSLWPVDDQATAFLMARFYEALLRDGLPPPAALRRAQQETAERWSSPFYWAGFTLYGEWRGFPVDWRPGLNLPRRTGSESVRANGARGAADARSRQKGEPNGQRAQEDPGPGGR